MTKLISYFSSLAEQSRTETERVKVCFTIRDKDQEEKTSFLLYALMSNVYKTRIKEY